MHNAKNAITRRGFLGSSLATALVIGSGARDVQGAGSQSPTSPPSTPWYRRAYLWGQTNITEKDPVRYDISWWREQWKRTQVQALIINAGGIVAYYPSKFPLHHRAEFLKGRDLFGELTKAAHDDGLFVMARMDSNRTAEDFFTAQPEWFARDRDGNPYRAADKYITCINSPYYDEYLPGVLREIIGRSRPDGFTDNSDERGTDRDERQARKDRRRVTGRRFAHRRRIVAWGIFRATREIPAFGAACIAGANAVLENNGVKCE